MKLAYGVEGNQATAFVTLTKLGVVKLLKCNQSSEWISEID